MTRPMSQARPDRHSPPLKAAATLLIALLAGSWSGWADAQSPTEKAAAPKAKDGASLKADAPDSGDKKGPPASPKFEIKEIKPPEATLGDDIFVDVSDLPAEWMEKDRLDESKLVLYLDGEEVKGPGRCEWAPTGSGSGSSRPRSRRPPGTAS